MDKKKKPIKFPHNFKFEKTFYGFKVKSTGGEFFPNKYIFSFIFPTIIILFISWGITLYLIATKYADIVDSSRIFQFCAVLIAFFPLSLIPIFYFLVKITNTKAEYLFSPYGIRIKTKKDSLFISKKNITKIYVKQRSVGVPPDTTIFYALILEFKEPIKLLSVYGKIKEFGAISLFNDFRFKRQEIADELLRKINSIIKIRNNQNEKLETQNDVIEDIKLPKKFHYQDIGYGFKINSNVTDFFSNNIFKLPNNEYIGGLLVIPPFLLLIGMMYLKDKPELEKIVYSYIFNLKFLVILFIFTVFFVFFIVKLFINAEYIFSSAGINIISIKGTFFIPNKDIENIYIQNEVDSSIFDETSIIYKICVEFKKTIYFKYLNENKVRAVLFKVEDKNIANYFVQKIKAILGL